MVGQTSPSIAYKCPSCKAKLESPGELAGKHDICPLCGKTCDVPRNKQQKAEEERRCREQEAKEARKQLEAARASREASRLEGKHEREAAAKAIGGSAAPRRSTNVIVAAVIMGASVLLATAAVIWHLDAQERARLAQAKQVARAAVQIATEKAEAAKAMLMAERERERTQRIQAERAARAAIERRASALIPYQLRAMEALDQIGPDISNADVIQLNKASAELAGLQTFWNSQGGQKVYGIGSDSERLIELLSKADSNLSSMQTCLINAAGRPDELPMDGPLGEQNAEAVGDRDGARDAARYGLHVFNGVLDPSKTKILTERRISMLASDFIPSSDEFVIATKRVEKVYKEMAADFHGAYMDWTKAQHEITQAKAILSKPTH